MRTVFLSALVGASVSFASYTVQANQTGRATAWFSRSLTRRQLRHEAIPELKWPAMTMPFTLSSGATLNGAKPGMK
ncbi:MAG: copper-binding protein [Enterobacter hormaechei]